ncbi:MAG: Glu-tRNA(Gln) amidotransferase subunit GatE [Candidatus Asgardarchaeia archaeon]
MKIDYEKIGLKVGLEIHQQLNTTHKLFCSCPTILREDNPHFFVLRELRPTQSELGEIDPAARFEYEKGKKYVYEGYYDTTCLVELDEEPPHPLNLEAVEIVLTMAELLNSKVVDEVHVMRKIVIDGSNTSGFQRTAIVALGGYVEDLEEKKKIGIQTICLEEDAARKINETDRLITYRLDRLGIPLIEIATAPDITTPAQARRVALRIGQLLRATGRVKRGLGTIRQDLNVSIKDGAIIEIKGVQKLELIDKIVENEALRQLKLLEIKRMLYERNAKPDDLTYDFKNLNELFRNTKSKVIQNAIKKKHVVLGVKLPKFAGILGYEVQPNRRFGTELADYVKFWAGLKGIFHTDELPNYGISQDEVNRLREVFNCDKNDAVVIVAGPEDKARTALEVVVNRCKEAFNGVPEETRAANPDGTTHYSRPRPGSARMYPETDIPPVKITERFLQKIKQNLPELPEKKYERFVKEYGLSEQLAKNVIRSIYLSLFEEIVTKTGVSPVLVATTLVNTMKSLRREGIAIDEISEDHLLELFKLVSQGKINRDAIPRVLEWISKNPNKPVHDAISALGLSKLSEDELSIIIEELLQKNKEYIAEKGERAFGKLMGDLMKEVRGRADGKFVSEMLRKKLSQFISKK